MVDSLRVFDFRDSFTLTEVACLCWGVNPEGFDTCDPSRRKLVEETLAAAVDAASSGAAECAIAWMTGGSQADLEPASLCPRWALERIPGAPGLEPWTPMPPGRFPEAGFDHGPPESWAVNRERVAAWLTSRNFEPSYPFQPRGPRVGALAAELRGVRDALERANRSAQRRDIHATFERIARGGARPASTGVRSPADRGQAMKRGALIAAHERCWPTVERDLKDAAQNGLREDAKAPGHGMYWEQDALAWAKAKGRLRDAQPLNIWPKRPA